MSDIARLLREAATYVGPCGDTELVEKLLAAAESLGEPVAWLCVTDDGGLVDAVVTDAGKGIYAQCGRTIQPLYLAPQPAVPEWRPIETAPKNRTPMIVVCGVLAPGCITDPWCVWWQGGEWARWPHRKPPTHWMPLPEPPAGDSHHE